MQEGIKQHPDFSTQLKYYCTHQNMPLIGRMDACNRFLNTKQEHKESLSDYYARFKQEYDTIKSLFGTKIFDAGSEKLNEYTSTTSTTKQDAIKKRSFNALLSCYVIVNRINMALYSTQ
jgi:hypothetical protein